MKKNIFPFTAIVGQEKIKKALILNAINPSIGGVLIKGDRGTGKTTAVRALANLLPEIEVVKDCIFNCDIDTYKEFEFDEGKNNIETIKKSMEVVELPLGATEDKVVGSLDIEKALKSGIKALEPGLLAKANRNILYVDEINLLDDNLVDILLDAAAFGINTIEREGISLSHPSKFILVGTMNPEEGELRGQLSDRIGLKIDVGAINNIKDRILIMARREEFEKDPKKFIKKFDNNEKELQNKILKAQKILNDVEIDSKHLEIIARITLELDIEGHRSDIFILKTAKTIAAYNERESINDSDLEEAIELVIGENVLLSKRMKSIKQEMDKENNQMELNKDISQEVDMDDIEQNEESEFKIIDDEGSKINEEEKSENFTESDEEGKIDIKN
ncbi:ATP-binding protein [Methanobrevibacter sp. DSM 116169]|uniref:ATP-binding protein n=1 Tax=Methanobrevibacter sp. DSM 116169 TaxID=3242727 RepID=UPI0038FBF765